MLGQSEGKDALGDSLAKLGVTADHLSVFANKHAEAEGNFFEDPIRDYIRIVAAVKEALGHRGETQVALRNALADLEAKRVNVTKLKGVDGRERHLEEAEAAVTEAESVVAEVRTKHTTITDRVLTELERLYVRTLRLVGPLLPFSHLSATCAASVRSWLISRTSSLTTFSCRSTTTRSWRKRGARWCRLWRQLRWRRRART